MARTKIDAALAASEQAHANDPERSELLARARRFKASWIELAEALAEAKRGGRWKRWGYGSFEEYAQKELLLKRDTAEKLTSSFLFLKQRAPEVLARDGVHAAIPSYQAVDFLRRAEAEAAPTATLDEIRRQVIDDAAPLAQVARKYREVVFPLAEGVREQRDATTLRQAARRLCELLDGTTVVPRQLAREVSVAVERLVKTLSEE